ncbi:MAG: DUF4838 domain-containing protein [Lentisphaerota bacterium]
MKQKLLIWMLAVSAIFCGINIIAAEASSLILVKDGQPEASIILSASPTRAAQLGAYELQYYIKMITNVKLPIVNESTKSNGVSIFVGGSNATKALGLNNEDFQNQEYTVKFNKDTIVLMGCDKADTGKVVYNMETPNLCSGFPGFWDEQGTLYAVYDFLERFCGVRWFNPTEYGTFYPINNNLVIIGKDIRRKPAFEYRDALGAIGDNAGDYDAYVSLWRWQTQVNNEGNESYKEWDKLAYPELHKKYHQENLYQFARKNLAHLFLLRMRNGGKIIRCNHSVAGYYQRFWDKKSPHFIEYRSEYFAKGYDPKGTPPQLCYTNPGLIKQIAQDARDYYNGKKTGRDLCIGWNPQLPNAFPVEPEDNSFFCKCAACQKFFKENSKRDSEFYNTGIYSDYFFNFINDVVKELKKTHPDKQIVSLAYMSHGQMPSFKLDPNVAIQFAFVSNRMPYNCGQYEDDLKILKQWAAEGVGRPIYLWLYYTFPVETAGNGKFYCFPGFFAHAIDDQFKLFLKYGIRGMFHCGYGQEVEAYVTFKLMDDPTLNVDDLLEDYFTHMYGKAAGPMKNIYLDIEKTYCDPKLRPEKKTSGSIENWGYLGTEERMAKYEDLLNQAKKLAKTENERRRITLFEKNVWDYMQAGQKQYLKRNSSAILSINAGTVPEAGGDLSQVDWGNATQLSDPWYEAGTGNRSEKKITGKIGHDSKYIYIELTDYINPKTLKISPAIFPYDDWEIFIANQRSLPCRQYAINPSAEIVALSHGEINMRMNVVMQNNEVKALSDTSLPDRWQLRMAIPMGKGLLVGVKPGEKIYMNILRISGPRPGKGEKYSMFSWIPYSNVHEVDRLTEITLEK